MPRRRASSTTNVVPARFMDGAIVFMKNVPNTSGNVDSAPYARHGGEAARIGEALREVLPQLREDGRYQRQGASLLHGLPQLHQLVAAQKHHRKHDDEHHTHEEVLDVEFHAAA